MHYLPSAASHSHLFPPSLDTQAASLYPPLPLLLPPPLTHNEQYCVQLEVSALSISATLEVPLSSQVDNEECAQVSVWVGECSVNKKIVPTKCSPVSLSHGKSLITTNLLSLILSLLRVSAAVREASSSAVHYQF